jgi:hypothetical protein
MECARIQMVHSLVIVLGVAEEMHLMQNARKIPSLSEHGYSLVRSSIFLFLSGNAFLFLFMELAGSHVELSLACCRIFFTKNKKET